MCCAATRAGDAPAGACSGSVVRSTAMFPNMLTDMESDESAQPVPSSEPDEEVTAGPDGSSAGGWNGHMRSQSEIASASADEAGASGRGESKQTTRTPPNGRTTSRAPTARIRITWCPARATYVPETRLSSEAPGERPPSGRKLYPARRPHLSSPPPDCGWWLIANFGIYGQGGGTAVPWYVMQRLSSKAMPAGGLCRISTPPVAPSWAGGLPAMMFRRTTLPMPAVAAIQTPFVLPLRLFSSITLRSLPAKSPTPKSLFGGATEPFPLYSFRRMRLLSLWRMQVPPHANAPEALEFL